MTAQQGPQRSARFPLWVPDAARHYLQHTETGLSIRALARASDCHPSTVLRQVRRFECRRDDPLIDAALNSLSSEFSHHDSDDEKDKGQMNIECLRADTSQDAALTQTRIDQEAKRILRRLCEQGAMLAVVDELETAHVVRNMGDAAPLKTATVDKEIAQAMALKDWISSSGAHGRISRYFITNTGRAALRRLTAQDENRASGFGERRSEIARDADWNIASMEAVTQQPSRYLATESPLVGLARRKGRDGLPFLKRELVAAGERLREDFELAQVGTSPIENWESVVTGETRNLNVTGPVGSVDACKRVQAALTNLGPGLGDVVLHCCCFLQGLEQTERKMGWSARSGKIVLRIALIRLKQHYDTQGKFGPMIG